MEFAIKILLNAAALFVGAKLLSGIKIKGFTRAIIIALVLALLNATIGELLDFVTTPLRWITLGLFALIVDALILIAADWLLKGFEIKNFWWSLALATFIALVNLITFGALH